VEVTVVATASYLKRIIQQINNTKYIVIITRILLLSQNYCIMKENKINEDIVWQRVDVINEAYDRF
jgi:hypothetical protein